MGTSRSQRKNGGSRREVPIRITTVNSPVIVIPEAFYNSSLDAIDSIIKYPTSLPPPLPMVLQELRNIGLLVVLPSQQFVKLQHLQCWRPSRNKLRITHLGGVGKFDFTKPS